MAAPVYHSLNDEVPRAELTSFVRLFVVWFVSVICGGITPGQTIFTPLFADAGLFASICGESRESKTSRCDQQDILIASILSGLGVLSLIGLLPSGILYDTLGARKVGILGTFLLSSGLLVLVVVIALAQHMATTAQVPLFMAAVAMVDCGSLMQNFGFYGLLFHLPGWQALIIGLSIGCTSVAALLPVVLTWIMDVAGISLCLALCSYSFVVCSSAGVLARVVPDQQAFFTQAQLVLGIPLPEPHPSWSRLRQSMKAAWHVLRVNLPEHFLVYLAIVFGNSTVYIYASLAVSFGSALFDNKADGDRLGRFYAAALALMGVFVTPLCGVLIDLAGLPAFLGTVSVCFATIASLCSNASWAAQHAAAVATAFFTGTFILFPTKYLLLFCPPQRFGTVQGLFLILMFLVLVPVIAAMSMYFASGADTPLVDKYIWCTQTFGALTALGWAAYAVRWKLRPEPDIILLDEEERDITARFSVRTIAHAVEVLDMTREQLLRMLASQDVLVQRELLNLVRSAGAICRYAKLCQRIANATITPHLENTDVKHVDALPGGATILDGTPHEAYTTITTSFNGNGFHRGEPFTEWMLESLLWSDPRRVKFLEDYIAINAHAAHRFGRILVAKAVDGTTEAACICYPPEMVTHGDGVPIFGERWLYGAHMAGRGPLDPASLDPRVFQRLVAFQQLDLPERRRWIARHWYVNFLAVAPDCRGQKRGWHLLEVVAAWADQAKAACYLECGRANVPFYEKCGYKVLWSDRTSQGGMEYIIYGMLRPAVHLGPK